MRSHRAVQDENVDRLQVQGRRRPEPSSTNSPPALPVEAHTLELPRVRVSARVGSHCGFQRRLSSVPVNAEKAYSGGFCPGVPPLPIPNREVKPGRADGTAPQCGRVGRRLLEERRVQRKLWSVSPSLCSLACCSADPWNHGIASVGRSRYFIGVSWAR